VGLCTHTLWLQPFTYDFPRADIHEILSPDLLQQWIKGSFRDHLVTRMGEYLVLEHGETCANEMMDDIGRRYFSFFGFNLYITVLIHFYSVSQELPHPQALVLVSRNQVQTMADMILAASEININRCRMCSEVLRLFNCCAFDQSSGCFRPGNNLTLERFRMTSDTISACNKNWMKRSGRPTSINLMYTRRLAAVASHFRRSQR